MDSLMNALGLYRVETKENDMNYHDYKAAVERLRRVTTNGSLLAMYGNCQNPYMEVKFDKATIYDADHDSEPATVEWLESIGFVWDKNDGAMYNGEFAIDPTTRTKHFPIYFKNRFVIDNPTRGDVLTALRLFDKKEGA